MPFLNLSSSDTGPQAVCCFGILRQANQLFLPDIFGTFTEVFSQLRSLTSGSNMNIKIAVLILSCSLELQTRINGTFYIKFSCIFYIAKPLIVL